MHNLKTYFLINMAIPHKLVGDFWELNDAACSFLDGLFFISHSQNSSRHATTGQLSHKHQLQHRNM